MTKEDVLGILGGIILGIVFAVLGEGSFLIPIGRYFEFLFYLLAIFSFLFSFAVVLKYILIFPILLRLSEIENQLKWMRKEFIEILKIQFKQYF